MLSVIMKKIAERDHAYSRKLKDVRSKVMMLFSVSWVSWAGLSLGTAHHHNSLKEANSSRKVYFHLQSNWKSCPLPWPGDNPKFIPFRLPTWLGAMEKESLLLPDRDRERSRRTSALSKLRRSLPLSPIGANPAPAEEEVANPAALSQGKKVLRCVPELGLNASMSKPRSTDARCAMLRPCSGSCHL